MKMNKTMLLGEVANRSGIPADECGVVLKTFERVLCEELTRKLYRYGGWILLLIGLFVSAFAFGQTSERKGRPVQTIRGMVVDAFFQRYFQIDFFGGSHQYFSENAGFISHERCLYRMSPDGNLRNGETSQTVGCRPHPLFI